MGTEPFPHRFFVSPRGLNDLLEELALVHLGPLTVIRYERGSYEVELDGTQDQALRVATSRRDLALRFQKGE